MLYYVLLVLFWESLYSSQAKSYLEDKYPASVIEDANLDTVQLIRKYKYPVETHYVTSAENYVIGMHRIPNPGGVPVFLMHGLLDSSATWILMGPHSGLGYFLHDKGYDVWMGNARGNRYSHNHTTLDPDYDRNFWNFSFHEIAVVDLPAMIDYVLEQTSHKKLGYVGHSQGTVIFWIMCSTLPVYNEKIIIMHALAPAAFFTHLNNSWKDIAYSVVPIAKNVFREFLPHSNLISRFCFNSFLTDQLCLEVFWQITGRDISSFNRTMWPVVLGHLPAGISHKQLEHFCQFINTDRFGQYDYGSLENQRYYGQPTPPDYPLEKITAPVCLYYTLNDALVSHLDVKRLVKSLSNVVIDTLYSHKVWNHMSVVWGIEARKLVFKQILIELRRRQ